MKKILFCFLTFYSCININAQNCFEVLSDYGGIDITDDLVTLENTACNLRSAFPTEYQSKFKVYDFGFYSNNEYMEDGFEGIWENYISTNNISGTTYYLAFGRQVADKNGNPKLWVWIKLPESNWLDLCYDASYIKVINSSIKNEFNPH